MPTTASHGNHIARGTHHKEKCRSIETSRDEQGKHNAFHHVDSSVAAHQYVLSSLWRMRRETFTVTATVALKCYQCGGKEEACKSDLCEERDFMELVAVCTKNVTVVAGRRTSL